jgi:hypothetical protein
MKREIELPFRCADCGKPLQAYWLWEDKAYCREHYLARADDNHLIVDLRSVGGHGDVSTLGRLFAECALEDNRRLQRVMKGRNKP